MLLQEANSSMEWKPHYMFLVCSKAFRNLSRETTCSLKIESRFKIIFAIKRMDKRCFCTKLWYRKNKVVNYDTGSQEHRWLVNPTVVLTYPPLGLLAASSKSCPNSWIPLACPSLPETQAALPEQAVLGRAWDSYWNDVAVGKGAVTEGNGSVGTLPHSDQRKAARGFQISYDWFIIHGINNIYIA